MQLNVKDMACGGCAKAVTGVIRGLDDKAEVTCDVPARRVTVRTDRSEAEVRESLARAGFPAEPAVQPNPV